VLALAHPDAGGDAELFVWLTALHEHVAGDYPVDARTPHQRREPPQHPYSNGERVPFEAAFGKAGSFAELTRQAVMFADSSRPGVAGARLRRRGGRTGTPGPARTRRVRSTGAAARRGA
jgi:hypothetical protein